MKKKSLLLIITLLLITISAKADFEMSESTDFTGDGFFQPPIMDSTIKEKEHISNKTIPPFKKLRLNIQNKLDERDAKNFELAPTGDTDLHTGEISTSDFASKEVKDDFDDMIPDGFEADEEAVAEKGKKKLFSGKKGKTESSDGEKEDIILDCDNVDYDTPNYLIKANGNVNVNFVNQKAVVKADTLTFDRINNTIKAEGNVRILKNDRVITGDYIFVDLNEENALIEHPFTESESIEIRANKGYVYGDRLVQEEGQITVKDDYPMYFRSGRRGPQTSMMFVPKDQTLSKGLENGVLKLKAQNIKITQKGDLEILSIKKGKIYKGQRTVFTIPAVKVYTNKNHDYVESNFWEVGYYRGLGLYTGPSWVFELPKGSVLKAVPFFNYNKGAGIGGLARFSSGTNQTTFAYGTAASKFFLSGRQELDDNLFVHYGMNSYMDEWFLGRRRPKYGVGLVYNKSYGSNDFLIPGKKSAFTHRLEAGYFQDLDYDSHFERIYDGGRIGTTRFRYMAEVDQELLKFQNEEKLKFFTLDMVAQVSAALYGTGDTQVIGRIGPRARMQYRRWMQDIGYYFNSYQDNTPMPRFDSYRYGEQFLYIREYLRLCRWLTLSWFGYINTTNDARNGRTLQENTFYLTIGPDDFKVHIGYDFERQTLRCAFEMMMNAKGANVEYNTFEIKQEKKSAKSEQKVSKADPNMAPTKPKVLQKAVVENVKVTEDVL